MRCTCPPEERNWVTTVPWQDDFCGDCGGTLEHLEDVED